MFPSVPRSIRLRGMLVVLAAAAARCTPDGAECVAMPGSSLYVFPSTVVEASRGLVSLALQGREAPRIEQPSPLPAQP